MDSYFPKTRRPHIGLSSSLKRPPPSVTPPKAAKIPSTPTTPKDARLTRPLQPPPVKSKRPQVDGRQERRRPISVKELFKTVQPHEEDDARTRILEQIPGYRTPPTTPIKSKTTTVERIASVETTPVPASPIRTLTPALATPVSPVKSAEPVSPNKITSGPLKGLSSSLLDLIRAKEAAANTVTPEQVRRRELLGIAPEIVRIVPTVFTANKREVMLYDKVIDKCFKGLKSNYTSTTIIECLDLMDKVAPEWVSIVNISRGKFMRINRTKYTIPQLLQAIRRFQRNC